jgi:hypothetical protein
VVLPPAFDDLILPFSDDPLDVAQFFSVQPVVHGQLGFRPIQYLASP